ncbi:MAG: nucleotidyltransferase domain-containing protein [Spirochaetota bacterium]
MSILSKRRLQLKKRYYEIAFEKTNKAVTLLYSYGAREVYIFGSLTKPDLFDEMSDVDIYVKGLSKENRKGLFTKMEEIFGNVKFDLFFDDDVLRPDIATKIEREGKLWKSS